MNLQVIRVVGFVCIMATLLTILAASLSYYYHYHHNNSHAHSPPLPGQFGVGDVSQVLDTMNRMLIESRCTAMYSPAMILTLSFVLVIALIVFTIIKLVTRECRESVNMLLMGQLPDLPGTECRLELLHLFIAVSLLVLLVVFAIRNRELMFPPGTQAPLVNAIPSIQLLSNAIHGADCSAARLEAVDAMAIFDDPEASVPTFVNVPKDCRLFHAQMCLMAHQKDHRLASPAFIVVEQHSKSKWSFHSKILDSEHCRVLRLPLDGESLARRSAHDLEKIVAALMQLAEQLQTLGCTLK